MALTEGCGGRCPSYDVHRLLAIEQNELLDPFILYPLSFILYPFPKPAPCRLPPENEHEHGASPFQLESALADCCPIALD
jgi:hypothetical protein